MNRQQVDPVSSYFRVNFVKHICLLKSAIEDLQHKVAGQESRIAAQDLEIEEQKSRIARLETQINSWISADGK